MLTSVQYLSRAWTVAQRADGFVLTYTNPPPAHLTGRALLVTPTAVWECSRDGMATPLVVLEGTDTLYRLVSEDT